MLTHVQDLATGRQFDARRDSFHISTRIGTSFSLTYATYAKRPPPSCTSRRLLFDTLLMDIPYSDVAAGTLSYAAICFWSAQFW